ncbi:MAG: MFS transporter [Candidatus Saccharibacteria bacterium]
MDSRLLKILIVCTLASFLTPFMGSSIGLAIPSIARDLNSNAVAVNWVLTSFLLASAACLLPFGRLADMKGRRSIFMMGLAVFAVSSVLCGAAASLILLVVARVLQGIGGAMMFSTGMAILTASFPVEKRGMVLGFNAGTVYVGLALGPVLGGLMTDMLGWRSIFLTVGVLAVGVVGAAWIWLPNDTRAFSFKDYDKVGALLITFSIVAIIFGAEQETLWIALAGTIGLILFWLHERRAKVPLLDVKVFANNTAFTFSNLAALINYAATYSNTYLLSMYLQMVRGMKPQHAGMILLIQPVFMAVLSPVTGYLSDKMQPRLVASLGMAITAAGMFLMAFIGPQTSIGLILVYLAVLGIGFALFASPNNNAIMSSVEKRYFGVASSTLGTARLVGQAMSMALVAFIFAQYIGRVKITPALAPGLLASNRMAFLLFGTLCVIGILASISRGKAEREEPASGA